MLKDTMKDFVNEMREAEKELMFCAAEHGMFEELDVHGGAFCIETYGSASPIV